MLASRVPSAHPDPGLIEGGAGVGLQLDWEDHAGSTGEMGVVC